MSSDWARERREAATEHADRLRRRQEADSSRAQRMLHEFAAAAARAGLPAEPLLVRGYGGRGSARTGTQGWYLRRDRTLGVGRDGSFYLLTAPLTLRERIAGVKLVPVPPPLVLGAGGRDGESIELADALANLLPDWQSR